MIKSIKHYHSLIFIVLLFCMSHAHAQDTGLQNQPNGTYMTNQGWGVLKLGDDRTVKDAGAKSFAINAVGTNGHFCDLSGTILPNGIVHFKNANDEQSECVIHFKSTETGINISTDDESMSCHSFCGNRAFFTGDYNTIQPICKPDNIRSAFVIYESSHAADEINILKEKIQPILTTCASTISDQDKAKLQQATALINYHAHNLAACQEALAPYQKIIDGNDADIDNAYPTDPTAQGNWRIIAKKMRDISALCQK